MFIKIAFFLFLSITVQAQVLCIDCFRQNEAISPNANNLVLNGSFEDHECDLNSNAFICPSFTSFNCEIDYWTALNGGTDTYASAKNDNFYLVPDGLTAIYFGNFYASICSSNSNDCLLYTSPSPRDLSTSRMPSSA